MLLFRRVAFLLAIGLPALHVLQAQDSSSSSTPAASTPAAQDQTQPTPAETQGQLSVQARIKARREQRRAQAIHDTYAHLYEAFVGGGYLRTKPGPDLQRVTLYSWNAALTRYYGEKLGATVDGRGYYGTTFVGLNESAITRPAISEYTVMGGPTYRFYMRPKYSLAAHALGGVAIGNFTSDTNGFGSIPNPNGPGNLLYPDSTTYAFSGGILGEMNLSPNLSLRLAGEYVGTGFGSEQQNGFGFNYGFVYRFGKQ
ncbi:MAG TPA: hypothetical protein VK720_03955 [Terracidiphilus sp.]|jgi:hypothetical protein|nr:hypothetical protein [Terracidiphilus sp.]